MKSLEEKIAEILKEFGDEWDARSDATLIAARVALILEGEIVVYDPMDENHVVLRDEEAREVAERVAEAIREATGLRAEVTEDCQVVVRFRPEFREEEEEEPVVEEEIERRLDEVI